MAHRQRPLLRKGTVVRINSSTMGGMPRDLRVGPVMEDQRLGVPTIRVRGHAGIVLCCPHEVSVLRQQPARFDPMRFRLPYGIWTCADGREVLFNREYRAIWERLPDGTVREADPDEWVPFTTQLLYFQDGNTPWRDRETHRFCENVLASWSPPERVAPYPDEILFPRRGYDRKAVFGILEHAWHRHHYGSSGNGFHRIVKDAGDPNWARPRV